MLLCTTGTKRFPISSLEDACLRHVRALLSATFDSWSRVNRASLGAFVAMQLLKINGDVPSSTQSPQEWTSVLKSHFGKENDQISKYSSCVAQQN